MKYCGKSQKKEDDQHTHTRCQIWCALGNISRKRHDCDPNKCPIIYCTRAEHWVTCALAKNGSNWKFDSCDKNIHSIPLALRAFWGFANSRIAECWRNKVHVAAPVLMCRSGRWWAQQRISGSLSHYTPNSNGPSDIDTLEARSSALHHDDAHRGRGIKIRAHTWFRQRQQQLVTRNYLESERASELTFRERRAVWVWDFLSGRRDQRSEFQIEPVISA